MLMFEWILVLLLAAVILTNLAERLAVPYPSLLAIAGAGLAFLPFAPQIRIEPELALALFVAPASGAAERELSRAGVAVMQAALDSLDGDTSRAATTVREQFAAARKVAEGQHEPQAATKYDELRLRAIAAQRGALHRLRVQGEIGDEAFHRLQEELDWAELDAAPAGSFQSLAS
jgi:hypothetical protein